jgi:hypothetical protein
MKGASRGVCVLRKESPASGSSLRKLVEQTHERRFARRLRTSQGISRKRVLLTKTCGADAINYRRI